MVMSETITKCTLLNLTNLFQQTRPVIPLTDINTLIYWTLKMT